MNIYQRLNEVRKKVAYVKKDATVQGYKAVTHDMVTAMVRDHLIENGIVIVPSQIQGRMLEAGTTQRGSTIYRYEATYNIAFVNADDPADRFEIMLEAHANDQSDKAPGKACSYAVKYALLKVFNIETGENEESRLEGDRQKEQMLAHIKDELTEYLEHGDSLAVFLLSQKVGQEAWTDIYNSAPEGKKTAFKKELGTAETEGAAVFKEINRAILTEDAGAAAENIEDVTAGGKRLLAEKLGHEKATVLGNLVKQLDAK